MAVQPTHDKATTMKINNTRITNASTVMAQTNGAGLAVDNPQMARPFDGEGVAHRVINTPLLGNRQLRGIIREMTGRIADELPYMLVKIGLIIHLPVADN